MPEMFTSGACFNREDIVVGNRELEVKRLYDIAQ